MVGRRDRGELMLPALCSAHPHAFQRAMRGAAQRRGGALEDDFWSWRQAMYGLAGRLDPEQLHRIARVAYAELYAAGVRTVGEFHYLHHQPDGTPYAARTCMSDAVIQAARDEGLRIALLRVVYARAGHQKPPQGAQRRFSDPSLEVALADVDTLRARYQNQPDVRIGLAPHSVRALPPSWLRPIAEYAASHALPLHMHVAEQPAEISACLEENGLRPVELLSQHGVLSSRFVAVHATHLLDSEAALLGSARSFVCLCPTTERDLGDGLPNLTALDRAGVRLCVGIDSHVVTAPLEDLRGVELGERLRSQRRIVLSTPDTPAERLWRVGSQLGAQACGFDDAGGSIAIDTQAPSLQLVQAAELLDAIVFSAQHDIFAPARVRPDGAPNDSQPR